MRYTYCNSLTPAMSPSILRRLFVLGAALVVFGSVLFSRFTAPGVLPPQGSAEPRDAAWRFTGGTGVAVETGSSGAAGDVSNPIEVLRHQVKTAPPRPSELVSDLPVPVEKLILELLEKDPASAPRLLGACR